MSVSHHHHAVFPYPAPRFGYHAVNLSFLCRIHFGGAEMVIVSQAFHIYIWVALLSFFLRSLWRSPSRNAALSFLETQDCIKAPWIPPFLSAGDRPLGCGCGDGGDSGFGIPLPTATSCHPHPLHFDSHVDDSSVFGYPLCRTRHRHAAILLSSQQGVG